MSQIVFNDYNDLINDQYFDDYLITFIPIISEIGLTKPLSNNTFVHLIAYPILSIHNSVSKTEIAKWPTKKRLQFIKFLQAKKEPEKNTNLLTDKESKSKKVKTESIDFEKVLSALQQELGLDRTTLLYKYSTEQAFNLFQTLIEYKYKKPAEYLNLKSSKKETDKKVTGDINTILGMM